MKILTRQEVENKKKKEQDQLYRRGVKMMQFVEEARKELNDFKASKAKELLKLQAHFDKTFNELADKRMKLEADIKDLEQQKLNGQ